MPRRTPASTRRAPRHQVCAGRSARQPSPSIGLLLRGGARNATTTGTIAIRQVGCTGDGPPLVSLAPLPHECRQRSPPPCVPSGALPGSPCAADVRHGRSASAYSQSVIRPDVGWVPSGPVVGGMLQTVVDLTREKAMFTDPQILS